MSDETVRPALTPEEWAKLRVPYARNMGEPERSCGTEALIGALNHLDNAVGRPAFPNALAAVALCREFNGGQQRGFTWEDVRLVREMAEEQSEYNGYEHTVGFLNDLADRIAALLPPETP